MSTTFSFVVPACNVEEYAEVMIASLKAQTIIDFEAIIVNEESSDNTLQVLNESINNDVRFRLISIPCSGSASASRNYGLENSKNEYIVFVDGDDWIEPEALEEIAKVVELYQHPDIILVDWVIHRTLANGEINSEVEICHQLEAGKIYAGPVALAERLKSYFQPGSPAHICRREFLLEHNLRQCHGRRHQDCEWMPRVNFAAKSVVYIPMHYYHYRKRENSVTTQANPRTMVDLTDNIISFLDFFEESKIPDFLRKPLADWCGENLGAYFAAKYAQDYSYSLRRREFIRLCRLTNYLQRIDKVLEYGGVSKKILLRIVHFAQYSWGFYLSSIFYRQVYYPLILPLIAYMKRKKR